MGPIRFDNSFRQRTEGGVGVSSPMPVLVAGAGGFIGGHLVGSLLDAGHSVRAVDRKPIVSWYQCDQRAENLSEVDLTLFRACKSAVDGVRVIYNLASDMGGIGFIERHRADCMLSVLINTQLLLASRHAGVYRYFFASSACVYPDRLQARPDADGLREEDAYPAMPEKGYGWEKLFGEQMCQAFHEEYGIETRIARYHNIYGPMGAYLGGREKAPAAISRKVAEAVIDGHRTIEIWGDGEQSRSFTYIDDAVEGTQRLMSSNHAQPLNIGSEQQVTINELVTLVESIAGVKLVRRHVFNAPQGVRGRNSDNTAIEAALHWSPKTPLRVGLERTYRWIYDQIAWRRC